MSKEKDFSNPHKLGFMRFIQACFAANICITIGLASMLIKGDYNVDPDLILALLNPLADAVSFWLIWKRKLYTRQIIMFFSGANIIVGSLYNVYLGTFDIGTQILLSLYDIILFVYFATSRRAKAILVEPLAVDLKKDELRKASEIWNPRKLTFWRNLAIYFCIFSIVGHWMEAAVCLLIKYGIVPGTYDPNSQIWSDWLYPFPVYGIGFVACALLLFPIKTFLQKKLPGGVLPLATSFVVNGLVCGAIEFVMGMVVNQPLPDGTLPLWDYSNMAFNIMGQVCLLNTCFFGFVATIMTWIVYPRIEEVIARLPKDIMTMVTITVFVGFTLLIFLYYINIGADALGMTEGMA